MKKIKKLTVEVANPKSDEYFTKQIEEINKKFKMLYKSSNNFKGGHK